MGRKLSTIICPLIILFLMLGPTAAVRAADCSNTSTGLIPFTELGTGTYQGFQGGLYPLGFTSRPAAHQFAGIFESYMVRPRDAKGLPKPHGKIVLLSIGMSNTTQEYTVFQTMANADPLKSPKVQIVDGAQGGKSADRIYDMNLPSAQEFWSRVDQRLAQGEVTAKQVQAVWIKQADAAPLSTFPEDALQLKLELKAIVHILKQRFRNLRMIFFSSRIYGGYSDAPVTRGEPVSYQTGFAVKWLIEDQLNGDPDLNFDPRLGEVKAPWLSWGPYIWADGTNARQDGLTYVCTDFNNDGHHPAPGGAREKVATMLLDFFKTDSVASRWFRAN